jgi:Bacterial conjugation TrbI-like protein
MEPEKTTRISKAEGEPERLEAGPEAGAPAEIEEPKPIGLGARLRQLVEQAKQDSRPNIKREQLKQNRTKSFLMLAGSMVVMALLFFAMFSSPANNRRNNSTHTNAPNLGRGPGNGNTGNDGRSITPLLSADTRNPDDEPGGVTPDDINNTARRNALANASPSFGPPVASPPPSVPKPPQNSQNYALNQVQFPPEPQSPPPAAVPIAAPVQEKLTKTSLVFVQASTGSHEPVRSSTPQPAVLERNAEFTALPPGTRLVARLETPVSTAVKAPVVAAIEYNYERDGEIVIPAGSRAFGELDQSNDRGFVGIRFQSIQLPDETEQRIEGRSMSLDFEPLKGKVTGTNAGKRFLARTLTGVGMIAAAAVGTQGGLGVSDTISNNVLLRQQVANNLALAGNQELTELAYRQNIVVTVPGNTRFYIVLAKPSGNQSVPARQAPASNGAATSLASTALPSVQELRELMELKSELTQMYQQQQQNTLQTTSQAQRQE